MHIKLTVPYHYLNRQGSKLRFKPFVGMDNHIPFWKKLYEYEY